VASCGPLVSFVAGCQERRLSHRDGLSVMAGESLV